MTKQRLGGAPVARGRAASLVATLALARCGCAWPASDVGRPMFLTTFTVLADISPNVVGNHLRGESITTPDAEIHGYVPTPRRIATATEADLPVESGLGLEAWFAQLVESVDVPHVVASDRWSHPLHRGRRCRTPNPMSG